MPCPVVRAAAPTDAAAINRIYNHYVRHTPVTFDIEPWSMPRRRAWLARFTGTPYHALVAELDGSVAGFAFNHRFRDKAAYRRSTETTLYTAPENQARGIGTALYESLFQRLGKTELHRAYAVIALPNPGSLALHRQFGFTRIGTLRQAGHKFGRYIDVAWLEKALS